jgi:hypothetical protein
MKWPATSTPSVCGKHGEQGLRADEVAPVPGRDHTGGPLYRLGGDRGGVGREAVVDRGEDCVPVGSVPVQRHRGDTGYQPVNSFAAVMTVSMTP